MRARQAPASPLDRSAARRAAAGRRPSAPAPAPPPRGAARAPCRRRARASCGLARPRWTRLAATRLASAWYCGLALGELDDDRRGEEQRGVRPGGQADEQDQREVLDRADAEEAGADEQQAGHRQQRDQRGVDRAHQRLVDRQVGRLGVGRPRAGQDVLGVLGDLVVDDDRVVERETEDGQQADDRRRRDLEADERVDAGRDSRSCSSATMPPTAIRHWKRSEM